uniref:Serine/threonine-protein kinase n=1 Tax=Macrostomum lignano TaxID=282301 RepID=A0A1I8FIG7_9PLAT
SVAAEAILVARTAASAASSAFNTFTNAFGKPRQPQRQNSNTTSNSVYNMNLMKLTPPTPAGFAAASIGGRYGGSGCSSGRSRRCICSPHRRWRVLGSEVILVEQTVADSLQFYTQQQHQQSYLSASGNSRPNLHRANLFANFSTFNKRWVASAAAQQQQQQHQQQQQNNATTSTIVDSTATIGASQSAEARSGICGRSDPPTPYSFSTLIYMALKSLKKSKMDSAGNLRLDWGAFCILWQFGRSKLAGEEL